MGKYTAVVDDRLILPGRVVLTLGQERRLHLSGGTVPAGVPVSLLIDTGSGRSSLVPWVLQQLNPVSQGRVRLETSLGIAETTLFWVRIEFPNTPLASIPQLAVARAALPPTLHQLHGVIGRDLLRRWESFVYQGRRGKFTIRDTPGWLFAWLSR